jgi:MSHA biogenesis protein MshI
MKITLPRLFKKHQVPGRLAVMYSTEQFIYAQADVDGRLLRCGQLARGSDTPAAFARQVQALGLPGQQVSAVLPLSQAQLLQVEAPAVKPEEMKAAARWRIKDQVEGRLDDAIIDVMFVGDDKPRLHRQLFVAAARGSAIRELSERSQAAGLAVTVIDIAETTQRNLQAAQAVRDGLAERATAALVQHGEQCLLTMCVAGELYYTRRLDWDALAVPGSTASPGVIAAAALATAAKPVVALETLDFIDYGAEPDATPGSNGSEHIDGAPRLVVELQRSFDVWERSWPDLPLARLWVQVGELSPRLSALLTRELGQAVGVLDIDATFPELAACAPDPTLREALRPVLGLLLRTQTRRL